MDILTNLKWRYATKRMNGQKVSSEKLENILAAIQLAPSSIGLQPYTIFVIGNQEMRARMAPAINNQPQITEGSHVLVFAAWTEISEERIEKFLNNIASTRGISGESLIKVRNMIARSTSGKTPEQLVSWTSRQAYLALGFGLVAAAVEQVDATPMEGFNPDALDEVLGLKEQGLHSAVVMTLGYRDAEKDALSSEKKVRRAKDELFVSIR